MTAPSTTPTRSQSSETIFDSSGTSRTGYHRFKEEITIPALVFIGANNSMTPQQNAGTFIGQVNNGGWDANMKFQAGKSGNYDVLSYNLQIWSLLFDSFELIDGQVNTFDLKPDVEGNV